MFTIVQSVARIVRAWNERRVAIMTLSAMDDHQLSDIGIERGMVVDAVNGNVPHHAAGRG